MQQDQPLPGGCCGPKPRINAIPPNTGPPDNHKVNVIWYFGFALVYFVSCCYAFFGFYGNFLFYPLVFLTALTIYQCGYKRFVKQHRINSHRTRLPDLFRAFAQAFFTAGVLALMVESVISIVIAIVFLNHDKDFSSDLSSDDYNGEKTNFLLHLYYFLQAFFVAGLVEEYCKGFLLQYTMKLYIYHRNYLNNLDIETIVWLGLSIGLGFGSVEGVLYVCLYGGQSTMLSQLILWTIRVFVAIPFHTIMGIMWGCELSKRDVLKYNSLNNNNLNININDNDNNNNNINNNDDVNIDINVNNINNNRNSYTGFKAWFYLGIKQVLWHGCYDFIEMEFSLLTASDNLDIEIGMAIVGCIIALIITVAAGYASWRTYKRLVSTSRSELIPDDPDDQL